MATAVKLDLTLNQVGPGLEVHVEAPDGVVTEAWSCGTIYRGFAHTLNGRAKLDALVNTPRICGACGTAHLTAASRALDMITQVQPPPDAVSTIMPAVTGPCEIVAHSSWSKSLLAVMSPPGGRITRNAIAQRRTHGKCKIHRVRRFLREHSDGIGYLWRCGQGTVIVMGGPGCAMGHGSGRQR